VRIRNRMEKKCVLIKQMEKATNNNKEASGYGKKQS